MKILMTYIYIVFVYPQVFKEAWRSSTLTRQSPQPPSRLLSALILSFSILTTVRGKLHFWFSFKDGGRRQEWLTWGHTSISNRVATQTIVVVKWHDVTDMTVFWLYLACIAIWQTSPRCSGFNSSLLVTMNWQISLRSINGVAFGASLGLS